MPLQNIYILFGRLNPLLFSLYFWLCAWIANAQPITFNHLGTADGLSQNSVLTIQQDGQGFMWFGTRYGLNRFDSRNFKVYRNTATDSSGISNNYILSTKCDSRRNFWVGTINGLNKYDWKTDTFRHFFSDSKKPEGLSHNTINCIYEDRQGSLWIGTANGLNLLTSESKGSFKKFLTSKTDPSQQGKDVRAILEDENGNLWIGTTTGLFKLNKKYGGYRIQVFEANTNAKGALNDNYITCLASDKLDNLWIGTRNGGINLLEKDGSSFRHFTQTDNPLTGPLHNYIRQMITDRSGKIWIGTLEGINIMNPASKTFTAYQHDPEINTSLSNNSVYSLLQDKEGSVWVGTYHGGINVVYAYATSFVQLSSKKNSTGLSHNVVSAIAEDREGNLWIGTEGGGLNYFNRKQNSFRYFNEKSAPDRRIKSSLIKCILTDRSGIIWVGTHLGGLSRIVTGANKVTTYRFSATDSTSLSSDNVIDIIEDDDGKIWIGTDQHGVNILDKQTGKFQHIDQNSSPLRLINNMIRSLFKDSAGNIWIGTAEGVQVLKKNKTSTWFGAKYPADPKGLHASAITSIFEDSKKRIWLASYYGGLSLYNSADKTFSTFTQKDGLRNENILGILEDQQGKLWISSDYGICCFDPTTRNVWNYDTYDGLASNELTPGAYYKDHRGEMFFGSNHGLIHFFPESIQLNEIPPTVQFTALRLFNMPVAIHDKTGILTRSIGDMKTITFEYNQNIFTIEFVVLNYIKPRKNAYAYKLEGLENNWNYVENPSATYTNLSPGDYTLLIRGTNNDGIWSKQPARLHIRVKPPLWRTWWANILYALIFIASVFLMARFFLMRALLKREHEIHQAKLDFFTNISHEIRTHLTLILGPVEKVLLKNAQDSSLHQQLASVQSNGRRLLRLVNELMDFRKAESSVLKLDVSINELVSFLRDIFTSFAHLAQTHQIHSKFTTESECIELSFDPVQLEKVIFNLLINAYKFTPDGGTVSMHVWSDDDTVSIEVHDNGRGIAPAHLKKLFVNFFQVYEYGAQNTGYGIGLALSKSIVEQHKGSLSVTSVPADGCRPGNTVFTVKLLKGTQHLPVSAVLAAQGKTRQIIEIKQQELVPEKSHLKDKLTVLIVEDNDEVRLFLQDILGEQYQTLQTANGIDGLKMAFEKLPDLIISDVMMDQMGGLELCTRLKSDPRSSHIPVILLTAKTTPAHQIEGLKTGADAYITKPFHIEMLELTIRNIFSARDVLRQKFSRQVTLEPRQLVINTLDEKFIDDIIRLTEEKIENPEFGVNTLLKDIGISRAVLYKKLRALTGMSVNDFIKSIRLKKAAQLLSEGHLTVNEVSFSVGYEDRKYFSQEFKKQFGVNPSEYGKIGSEK